jgi:hypothetical protein
MRETRNAAVHQPPLSARASGTGRRVSRGIRDAASLTTREWNALLEQIRAVDGFADFLRPVPYEKLSLAAKNDLVVTLNVSRHGCHALLMNGSSVRAIDLPNLTLQDAIYQAGKLVGVLVGTPDDPRHESRVRARDIVLDVLQWEWETIASPVLAQCHGL